MDTTTSNHAESVTRSIAQWGSLIAALIFAVGFLTDSTRSWPLIAGQMVQVGIIGVIFIGYAMAWMERYEVVGSVVVLVGMLGFYGFCTATTFVTPSWFFLAVGAPALFHLAAVALHRSKRNRMEAKPS
jgi:hypothetical protein